MNDLAGTPQQPAPATSSQALGKQITALMRAQNPILWIVTREEARAERYLFVAAAEAGYISRTWDVAAGVRDMGGNPVQALRDINDPSAILAAIEERTQSANERCAWVLRDLPVWLEGTIGIATRRALRNLARSLPGVAPANQQKIIILSPDSSIPPDLTDHATLIDWPMPDRAEIAAILDVVVSANCAPRGKAEAPTNGTRDSAIDAAIGLSGTEAESCYAKSLVQLRRIDPGMVASEKKRVIAREKVLEWFDPLPGGLDAVGGLETLKTWLVTRALAYSPKARAYGLLPPRGVLMVGVPGGGKSLTAKAIATAWNVPLLRLDIGALLSKFVGESGTNFRKALRTIEAIGRCVVWVDEIEKALAGGSQGASDGGVSSDILGALLSWLQEQTSGAFVVATANDVTALPPELLRKGRFDELFFIDLPTPRERLAILDVSIRKAKRDPKTIDREMIVDATAGWTGAEIAALIPESMFAAFADGGREITTADLLQASKNVVPLSKTAPEKIAKLREWGAGRARNASAVIVETVSSERRLDL